MTVRVRYLQGGEVKEGSIEQLLVPSGGASTRVMKYVIKLTEILVEENVLDKFHLDDLAAAYQADVRVLSVEVDDADKENVIDVTPRAIENKVTE